MQFIIRTSDSDSARFEMTRLQAIEASIPQALVDDILEAHACPAGPELRFRKLCLRDIVYLLVAMHLFGREGMGRVLEHLWHTWHLLSMPMLRDAESPATKTPRDSAIHYRRAQLGVAPMVALFHAVCRPQAAPASRGAFLWGMRTMAIDGKCINLADTGEIERYFGRPSTDRGAGAFPQARLVTFQEVGTRATIDAGVWPLAIGEQEGAHRLLRSVTAEMLILIDRGFYSFDMISAIAARGAQVICRLPAGVKPQFVERLADGTTLVRIAPAGHHPHKPDEGRIVRLITYTFQDPPGPGKPRKRKTLSSGDNAP